MAMDARQVFSLGEHMQPFLIQLVIAVVILAVALWAITMIAPSEIAQLLRVIAVAAFLIFLIVRALPLLGVG